MVLILPNMMWGGFSTVSNNMHDNERKMQFFMQEEYHRLSILIGNYGQCASSIKLTPGMRIPLSCPYYTDGSFGH